MWLENKKYREIRTALHSGGQAALDRVLHEITAEEKDLVQPMARCPVCHKELKRGTLPYLEFFGAACPDFHGWWLSPEISTKLRDFIREQMSLGVKKARQFKMLLGLFAFLAGLVFLNGLLPVMAPQPKKSSAIFLVPLPSQNSAVQSAEEWKYLLDAAGLLEKGIVSRAELQHSFKSRASSEDRWKAFNRYRDGQKTLMEKFRSLPVPEKLLEFNGHILKAFEKQIVFYAALLARAEDSTAGGEGQERPALKAIHAEVTAAYDSLTVLYPSLDPQTRMAIQERLFSLEEV